MQHKDLVINHKLESWTYADAAARTGAIGFVGGDVGRVSYQTDTGQYWRLTDDSPVTWALIAPQIALSPPAYASFQQATPQNPTSTASAIGVMMGLGTAAFGSNKITPTATGKVLITMTGNLGNTAGGIFVVLSYGSGTAPINGAPITGTQVSSTLNRSLAAAGIVPFSNSAVVTGLTVGTAYWIDAVVAAQSGGTALIANVSVTAAELP